jgi:hypothetical protein
MALVVFGAAVASSSAAALTPPDYFGGQDNQGYLDWIAASPITDWTSTTYLAPAADPVVGAAVHWFINNATGTVELAVTTKSTGWMAFGLSPTGGMLGSDLFVVEASNLTAIKDN